jgi:trigger factor
LSNTQCEIKEQSATNVTLQVRVDPATVKSAIDSVYKRYSEQVQIPGFRKGHVPRAYLDSRFGSELFTEEAQKDMEDQHLKEALVNLNLLPVKSPEVESESFEEDGAFVFTASFPVLPEIKLPEYRGIELTVEPPQQATEDEINAALEDISKRFATLAPKESQTIEAGDVVRVKEGEHEWDMRVESDNSVTSNMIGHQVGQTVDLQVEREGQEPLRASLSVVEVSEVVVPEIDDDLAKDAGFDSLDALRADIKEKITESKAERRRHKIEDQLLDHIVSQMDIPLPQQMVDDITSNEVKDLKERLEDPEAPMTFDDYLKEREKSEEELISEYREGVEQRLRRELVMGKLIESEGIVITDEELEQIATEEAKASGEDPIRFIARLKANEQWEGYHREKVSERVFNVLYENAKLTLGG